MKLLQHQLLTLLLRLLPTLLLLLRALLRLLRTLLLPLRRLHRLLSNLASSIEKTGLRAGFFASAFLLPAIGQMLRTIKKAGTHDGASLFAARQVFTRRYDTYFNCSFSKPRIFSATGETSGWPSFDRMLTLLAEPVAAALTSTR